MRKSGTTRNCPRMSKAMRTHEVEEDKDFSDFVMLDHQVGIIPTHHPNRQRFVRSMTKADFDNNHGGVGGKQY